MARAENAQGAFGRTGMTSPAASRLPTSDFSSIQPRQQPTLPFAGGGTATMGLGGASVNYPYSRGMMAGSPESFASRLPRVPAAPSNLFSNSPVAESLRPATGDTLNQQYTNPFALGLTPLPTRPTVGIGGGPMSLRGETAMTAPQTAEQRGLLPASVRGGTVYASPQQLANFNARTTAFEGRTPEQQQAMLAKMRFQGADTMRKNIAENQRIIDERRANLQTYTTPSGNRITAPTNMFGQPIASWQKTYEAAGKENEAALARMGRGIQPATLAQPAAGPSFGVRGVGGVTMPFESSALSGGPQPSTGFGSGSITRPSQYSNSRAEQRKGIRQLADAYGLPRPFSRGVENQYRQEFSRMGLLG